MKGWLLTIVSESSRGQCHAMSSLNNVLKHPILSPAFLLQCPSLAEVVPLSHFGKSIQQTINSQQDDALQ